MRMDSVVRRSDTIMFTMITVDSGTTKSGLIYNNMSSKRHMLVNDGLFMQDTLTGSWLSHSDVNVAFIQQPDTSYHWNTDWISRVSSGLDTSLNFSRHTDSVAVIVNGGNATQLFTTDSLFDWYLWQFDHFDHIGGMGNLDLMADSTKKDTLLWLDSVGVFYHIFKNDCMVPHDMLYSSRTFIEKCSLFSFNGSPVSITPINTNVKKSTAAAGQIPPSMHRKVMWLGSEPHRQVKPSAEYLNLQGRKLEGLKPAQVIIKKNKPASNAE